MTTVKILDFSDLASLLKPSRDQELSAAMRMIDGFLDERGIGHSFDSSELLNMMEQLTSDLSRVLSLPYASWYIEHPIDKSWSLTCQCQRINRLCRYNVVIWKDYLNSKKEPMTQAFPVHRWTEMLPEKN